MIGSFLEDFAIKTVVESIKNKEMSEFYRSLKNYDQWVYPPRNYNSINLKEGQVLYLYGGRGALVKALDELARDNVCVLSPTKGPMALFRTQLAVASGYKAKQLLMLGDRPDPLNGSLKGRLVDTKFEHNHFVRMAELQAVIKELPVLKK